MHTHAARLLRALASPRGLGLIYRALRYLGRRADMLADRIDPPAVPDTPETMLTADEWRRILDR